MKILYVTQRVPYPPNRGDKLAAYHAVRYLARRHAATVAALADSADERQNTRSLEAPGIPVVAVLIDRSWLGCGHWERCSRAAHSPWPTFAREDSGDGFVSLLELCPSMWS